jgi:hypothetical protein
VTLCLCGEWLSNPTLARTKLPESTVSGHGFSRAAQLVGHQETSPAVRGVPLFSRGKENL